MKHTKKLLKKKNKRTIKNSILLFLSLLLTIIFINNNLVIAQDEFRHPLGLTELKIVKLIKNQDEITLRLKAIGEEERPVMDLKEDNFKLIVTDTATDSLVSPNADETYSEITPKPIWKSPKDTVPDDAYIVVLFDMSGSMKCSSDINLNSEKNCDDIPKGERKYDEAMDALKKFVQEAKTWGGNTYISIVPFGYVENKALCSIDKSFINVDRKTLNDFHNLSDPQEKLTEFIDNDLSTKTPCTATNIYDSLEKSVKFLTNRSDERFYPVDEEGKLTENQPRLSIILFTDGFDTKYLGSTKTETENIQERQINKIKRILTNNPEFAIHTLGYGLHPKKLAEKYGLGEKLNWYKHIDWNNDKTKPIPPQEYLDYESIEKISNLTKGNGLCRVAGDKDEITESLKEFLEAILGEYEITYQHPNPEKGRRYEVISSVAPIKSNSEEYIIPSLGGVTAPPPMVVGALIVSILLMVLLGIMYFLWTKKLST
ncbi:MAG: vWA domain-containing protein [Crocosphaera sp.]|nr:vWA domain-containing protein [Crocosphaera sp.]